MPVAPLEIVTDEPDVIVIGPALMPFDPLGIVRLTLPLI